MLCMYNNVYKNYDVIIPYTHNTAYVIILLPLEIIHYTIHLTYNPFNNHLLREGYALLKCFSFSSVFFSDHFWWKHAASSELTSMGD